MAGLRAELMKRVPSDDGPQADVLFIEPNGQEHQLRCLMRHNALTELGEHIEPGHVTYLKDTYGEQVMFALAQQVTLGLR